jgi:hypothetical protein
VRKSRDIKDEIMQQRMATTYRLENMNLRPPQTWKQKADAYHRFLEMKNQMRGSQEFIHADRQSPRATAPHG